MSHIVFDGARRTIVLAGAVALTAGCTTDDRSIRFEAAALTLDVAGAPAAVFFTVLNESTRADSLTRIDAGGVRWVSMQTPQSHRMPGSSGAAAMLMSPVARVPIGAAERLRFAPGGLTGLLEGVQDALVEGDSVQITLRFSSGRTASTTAPVLPFTDLERTLAPEGAALASTGAPSRVKGEALYRANGCVSCHGAEGRGDGPVGATLVPPPRDFRNALGFRAGGDAERIARTLAIGIPGGGNMPMYAHLTNQERASLALLVISLRTTPTDRSTNP